MKQQLKIQHLYWRAGFGASPAQVQAAEKMSLSKAVKNLFKEATENISLNIVEDDAQIALKDTRKMLRKSGQSKEENRETIKNLAKERREQFGTLNHAWINQMGQANCALREKMTFFWHGHFACRSRRPTFMQAQNNAIRKYALGNFGDLLMAISKDAAMLEYLNNQQNIKFKPNENFAREVMELFTLGRGNYTEQDIKEAARAFTGWSGNRNGDFDFREKLHDNGSKLIFGKSGNFKGEDVIKLLLEKPETARFIAAKIYKYFVNDAPNESIINDLGKRFYKSNYDIADLMQHIFLSDWFYDAQNVGTKIKAPVELLAGFEQTLGAKFNDFRPIAGVQKVLGQVLFYPPNVAGWPGGQNWIDSSSLLTRMSLPKATFQNLALAIKAKDNGDANEEQFNKKANFSTEMDWNEFAKPFLQLSDNELITALASFLLQSQPKSNLLRLIEKQKDATDRVSQIKRICIELMSLPEYQLC